MASTALQPTPRVPRTTMCQTPSAGITDARKQVVKARRAVQQEGLGGMKTRAKAKRSEQKKPSTGKGFAKQDTGPAANLKYDRRPAASAECGCGSGLTYGDCCSRLHAGEDAATPSELVRSRFTAYKYRLPDYLVRTTDPDGEEWDADEAAFRKGLLGFCDDFEFQKLNVVDVREGDGSIQSEDDAASTVARLAQVDFHVDFVQKGTLNLMVLKERSTFRQTSEGHWLYAKGEVDYDAQSVQLTSEEKEELAEKVAEHNAKQKPA